MGLIDSHAHLTFPGLRERIGEVLHRCGEAGVDRTITVGINLEDSAAAVELARRHPGCVYAAGAFHPHEADGVSEADLAALDGLWDDPCVVALGEMGLDYHYDLSERRTQRGVLARQLQMASTRSKPLIIHCREAFDDVIPLLLDHGFGGRRVVFHCFTGTIEESKRVAEHGWRISFTGIVTFPNSTWLHEIAKEYPENSLMVETDSPYLSPVPMRGKHPNEPARAALIARFLAELREVPYEQFAGQTARNTAQFFNLPEHQGGDSVGG